MAESLVKTLTAAWQQSNKRKIQGPPKPIPGADGWMLYWVKRSNKTSSGGDSYLLTPHGNKLASILAVKRWLDEGSRCLAEGEWVASSSQKMATAPGRSPVQLKK